MTSLSKAEYLKRYMSGEGDQTKSKKKKLKVRKKKIQSGFKIVDEDIDLCKIDAAPGAEDEDEPTIAEVIDERPESVRLMEEYTSKNKWKKITGDAEYDSSPKRHRRNSDTSPSRQESHDYDNSPPRRQRHDSDNSPPRKRRHDSGNSLPRRQRHDSDNSPPRRQRHDSDNSPPRRRRHDSDNSPPRRQRHHSDNSPPRRRRHDSDNSPPRRQRHDSDNSPPRRRRHDSDNSPPRRQRHDSDNSPPRRQDSDNSPPQRQDSDNSPPRRRRQDSDNSPPGGKPSQNESGAKKTLSGKTAGLSSAKDMKKEAEMLKLKEIEMFNKIGEDKLGKNAQSVFRDKSGRKRDLKSEKQESDAKLAEWKDKYNKWAKGIAQGAAEQERVADMVHEMNKPLARGKDDADLDAHLKDIDREGDPMLQYMRKKKESKRKGPKYPQYQGRAPEPNRFGIKPGYRWDGVDRSNGFEKKYFQSISQRKAVSADAYKWSTEDM